MKLDRAFPAPSTAAEHLIIHPFANETRPSIPCTNHSGGQLNKQHFTKEAAGARHLWVKRVAAAMNTHFIKDGAPVPRRVLVCGGDGLKSLLCDHNDVHFKLRPMLWLCPGKLDPTNKPGQKSKKETFKRGDRGDRDERRERVGLD